ncbi:MAG TPA: hypothetical protein VEU28_01090, partial [Actinomycetota bacterium]|nr:hypothetical protein [Actinomycetota bacterium]
MPIACSYCGGTHPDAQSVRLCWSTAQPAVPGNGRAVDDEESVGPGFWEDDGEEAAVERQRAASASSIPRGPAADMLARARTAGAGGSPRSAPSSQDTAARPVVPAPGSPAP